MALPFLLFSDEKGRIYSHPFLRMVASSGEDFVLPKKEELVIAPKGSTFFYLSGRLPVGLNPKTKKIETLSEYKGRRVYAVAGFLIPGYLRLYNPAAFIKEKETLPLWAYTACGFYSGKFYMTAKKVDSRIRQSPRFYNAAEIKKEVTKTARCFSENRLYKHLANCALNYNCLAAKNLFLNRWEAPLPTSKFCNARCIGCLSYQDSDCIASHQRIGFKPSVEEIEEVVLNHLKSAREALVSFGQGCEGEPLLMADTIAASIRKVRESTRRGTINMNTNASMPKAIEMLSKAGMDSFRVSLNSTQKKFYDIYFRPKGYKFSDVLRSIRIAKKHNKFVSANLFIFPGFSDSDSEIGSLIRFVRDNGIDMIQWRNLNIDPAYYQQSLGKLKGPGRGVLYLTQLIKRKFPRLKTGYFNLPKERF